MPVKVEINHEYVGELGPHRGQIILPDPPSGVVVYEGDDRPAVHISAGKDEGYDFMKKEFTQATRSIYLQVGVPQKETFKPGVTVLVGYRVEVIKEG